MAGFNPKQFKVLDPSCNEGDLILSSLSFGPRCDEKRCDLEQFEKFPVDVV